MTELERLESRVRETKRDYDAAFENLMDCVRDLKVKQASTACEHVGRLVDIEQHMNYQTDRMERSGRCCDCGERVIVNV